MSAEKGFCTFSINRASTGNLHSAALIRMGLGKRDLTMNL